MSETRRGLDRVPCKCGKCGLTFVRKGRKQRYAVGCPTLVARQRQASRDCKRKMREARRSEQALFCKCGCGRPACGSRQYHWRCSAPRPCACKAGCGLVFPPTRGRRFHPQCPSRRDWARDRDRTLMRDGPKLVKRCGGCEDMAWRRHRTRGCRTCGKPYGREQLDRIEENALRGAGVWDAW